MADVFARFNSGRLESYLIEITAQILRRRDEDGSRLIDKILDAAAQKGTGRWTVESALDLGQPLTLISEAVFARVVSSLKDERVAAAKVLKGRGGGGQFIGPKPTRQTSPIRCTARKSSPTPRGSCSSGRRPDHGWNLDMAAIAPLWRSRVHHPGRIARSDHRSISTRPRPCQSHARPRMAAEWQMPGGLEENDDRAVSAGIPVPAYSSALAFYDGYRSERLGANLIQAQRDFFGAHTYERTDRPRGEFFHTEW